MRAIETDRTEEKRKEEKRKKKDREEGANELERERTGRAAAGQ